MLPEVLLTVTLGFTLPSAVKDAHSCGPGPRPLTRLGAVCYYARRQAPAWVANEDSLKAWLSYRGARPAAWDSTWLVVWRQVKDEAEPVRVLCNPAGGKEGQRVSQVTPPLGWSGPVFWHVQTCLDSLAGGGCSCGSNVVAVP